MARNDTSNIFKNYPDALTLCEFAEMLGIVRSWLQSSFARVRLML